MIAQYKKDWIVARQKPEEKYIFIIKPDSEAKINSSNRKTFSKLRRHPPSGID
jgi:hypothetical protein